MCVYHFKEAVSVMLHRAPFCKSVWGVHMRALYISHSKDKLAIDNRIIICEKEQHTNHKPKYSV